LRLHDIYYARLSGIHPTLPLSELLAVGEIEYERFELVGILDLLALFKVVPSKLEPLARRLAYTKYMGIVLGVVEVENIDMALREWLGVLKEFNVKEIGVSVDRIRGVSKNVVSGSDIITKAVRYLRSANVKVDMRSPRVLDIILVDGLAVGGLRKYKVELKGFEERRPRKRPFFKPGPLDPRLSRVMVNLSRLKVGHTFLDPFCGTGGLALEACLLGASRVLCGDIDREMAHGSYKNLEYYGCSWRSMCYLADATLMPLANKVDAVATDPPYGRSTSTKGKALKSLYIEFFNEVKTVVSKGGFLVVAGPSKLNLPELAEKVGLTVVEKHYMYVHGSLVRTIAVLRA
jgi:tRNA (guanine10-N2)-dimethyltransferase